MAGLGRRGGLLGSRQVGFGLALTLAISALGAVMGPPWRPRVVESDLVSQTEDTAVPTQALVRVGEHQVISELHEVELDGARITAQVRRPAGVEGPLPAVVFLHGAGTATNAGFAPQADDLASAGIVTVVPDKRMDTYTTGQRDYTAMARDYLHTVELARALPNVDPERVGLYAESEGAYIAPVMAVADPQVAFVMLVSAPIVPPRQQGAFAMDSYLRNVQVPASIYRIIPRALGGQMPFGMLRYADFDPAPYQQAMRQPTMLVFGTDDASMPVVQGVEQLIADLARAGNHQWMVRFYDGANHGIKIGQDLSDGFTQDIASWIHGLPATATVEPRIAGAQPVQLHAADPVAEPRALLSGNALVVTHLLPLGLLALGPLAYAVAGTARALRGGGRIPRTMEPGIAAWLGGTVVATLATWGVFAWYVKQVADMAFNYRSNPGFTFGAYGLQQALALSAAFALAGATLRVIDQRGGGVRLSGPALVLTAGTLAGSASALVLAAYWSGFPDVTGGFGVG